MLNKLYLSLNINTLYLLVIIVYYNNVTILALKQEQLDFNQNLKSYYTTTITIY